MRSGRLTDGSYPQVRGTSQDGIHLMPFTVHIYNYCKMLTCSVEPNMILDLCIAWSKPIASPQFADFSEKISFKDFPKSPDTPEGFVSL